MTHVGYPLDPGLEGIRAPGGDRDLPGRKPQTQCDTPHSHATGHACTQTCMYIDMTELYERLAESAKIPTINFLTFQHSETPCYH